MKKKLMSVILAALMLASSAAMFSCSDAGTTEEAGTDASAPSASEEIVEETEPYRIRRFCFCMGEGGFEPPKAVPADLQSVPFGHSGIPPGAGDRSRTNNLLITNQLLCH